MRDETKRRQNLKRRTKEFSLRVIKLCVALPKSEVSRVLGRQVLRSGTSIGAHYAEGFRAKSDKDFIHQIEGALQEADETIYWLELIGEAQIIKTERLNPLLEECNELTAIFVSMTKNVKARRIKDSS